MNLAELEVLWGDRDVRYAMRRRMGNFMPVTASEQESIVAFRRSETNDLSEKERAKALVILSNWIPPRR